MLDSEEIQTPESFPEDSDREEVRAEEDLLQEAQTDLALPSAGNATLKRASVSEKERHHNIANIGVLNRALMDLQFSSEAKQAVDICKDALSLVFEKGIIYLPDLDVQAIVHWQDSEGELSAEASAYLGSITKDLSSGWNSQVTLDRSQLPWESKNELFIYKTDAEKLGPVIWISETENSEKVTTGIATTCRQILLQFVGLWNDLQK